MATKKRKARKSNEVPAATAAPYDDAKWKAEEDLRTLERAGELMRDPSRMSAAKAEAKRKRESLDRIARLDGKKL